MKKFYKPIILVSKCLGFSPCRYNGQIENNTFVDKLKDYVQYITVCPESDSGLPTPRKSIRIVNINDKLELVQNKTGIILTDDIVGFSEKFLSNINEIDGFILKNKSPCCGIRDSKIYATIDKGCAIQKSSGFFAKEVIKKYPYLPLEDEGRLTNFKIREHFLTRIFLFSNFRNIKKIKIFDELKEFHLNNTLLFISYSQKYSKLLDSLIYNYENSDINKLFDEYENILLKLFERSPRYTSNINVLSKAINHFGDKISSEELNFIWNTIDKYKNGYVPFSVPIHIIKGYVIRFHLENLLNQSFFMPYPEDLVALNDSGKLIH